MSLTLLDHLFVGLFGVVYPLVIWLRFPALQRKLASAPPGARVRRYLRTIFMQWSMAIATLLLWHHTDRPFAALGLSVPEGWAFWVAAGMLLGLAAWAVTQLDQFDDPELRNDVYERLAPIEVLLPHTRSELRVFRVVAATAGICEELLFRGFLLWYLAQSIDTAGAAVVSSVWFGMAHAYQGPRGMAKTGLLALVLVGLYLLTGSLWVPMLLHAMIDAYSGQIAYGMLRNEPTHSHSGHQ